MEDCLSSINLLGSEYFGKLKEVVYPKVKPASRGYVARCGLSTMIRVYIYAYSCSGNDTAFKLARKALYYYLEFIGQISLEDHLFLNLTPRDATLFVYRKTIDPIQGTTRDLDVDLARVLELVLANLLTEDVSKYDSRFADIMEKIISIDFTKPTFNTNLNQLEKEIMVTGDS